MRPNQKCECGECKRCKHREYMRAYYHRPEVRERWRARVAERYKRPEVKAAAARAARSWEARNPEKLSAQKKARDHLARGKIERKGCEVCGQRAEMHHEDYSQPLVVRWFCRQHHKDIHARS
jgi:hypothetical protein